MALMQKLFAGPERWDGQRAQLAALCADCFDKASGNGVRPVGIEVRIGYARELLRTGRTVTVGMQNGTLVAAPVRARRAIR
jgi:hypothetical protein